MPYHHLTPDERYVIAHLRIAGVSLRYATQKDGTVAEFIAFQCPEEPPFLHRWPFGFRVPL
jgi:hypothetical protein